ncbi:MAG: glutaminyl-peptide cyclotransferase [Sphingobacteriales bacterium]|nr:glutaminyl-peptide cyclotransferase [Sphingobacteriales bacterium]
MKKTAYFFLCSLLAFASCTNSSKNESAYFLSPEAGTSVSVGDEVKLQLRFPDGKSADSVVYFVDDKRFSAVKDSQLVVFPTATAKIGSRLFTAKVYSGGEAQELSTNVIIKPAQAPEQFSYKVLATFAHDTSSYTQGLEFHDGIFYESDGEYGSSSLRKVDPKTGKVLKKQDLANEVFAEGLSILGDKLVQLTWKENVGLIYNKNSLVLQGQFSYQNSREGWGLCNNGERFYKSDGTNQIYFLNKDTYQEEGFIEVYNNQGPVDQLNELEYVAGKIYANVYQSDKIVIVDPKTGAVTGEIDMSGILQPKDSYANTDVLNGIAYDSATKKLYVTGKNWAKLFQIALVKN